MVDQSGLIQMFQEVERRVDEVVLEFRDKLINQKVRKQFQEKIHTALNTVFVAIFNDYRHLEIQIGQPLFTQDSRFHTIQELIEAIPKIYANEPEDEANAKEYALERMRWVLFQWMQLYANLCEHLPLVPAIAENRPPPSDGTPPHSGTLDEVFLIVGGIARLQRMTAEYLDQRATLLRTFGQDAKGLSVNWSRKPTDFVTLAWKAYWRAEPSAGVLILQALRAALLDVLQLTKMVPHGTFTEVPTHHLIWLAMKTGMPMPFGGEPLGNLAVDLEYACSRGEDVEETILFPAIRLIEQAVDELGKQSLTPEQIAIVRTHLKGGK